MQECLKKRWPPKSAAVFGQDVMALQVDIFVVWCETAERKNVIEQNAMNWGSFGGVPGRVVAVEEVFS